MHHRLWLFGSTAAVALVLAGCATQTVEEMPLGQTTFAQYAAETKDWIAQKRHFVTDNQQQELDFHAPFEVFPEGKQPTKGILLIHGLGDSPWTFRDIAKQLASHGFLVRTVILPGHGTKPADMIKVKSADWERVVNEQMAILKKDVKDVWIGGFSTGGNLAYKYAENDPDVKGMVLFSPALQVRSGLIKLAPMVDFFITWLRSPNKQDEGVLPFKYSNAPMDAIVAFKDTMDDSNRLLREKPYDKPSIVMLTEHDSILDVQQLLRLFDTQLTNPDSKIIWYGSKPKDYTPSNKVEIYPDYLPEKKILSFSHMSLPFSPDNEWYGEHGKYRTCRNSMSKSDYEKCMTTDDLWYGAWGAGKISDKITARLTYNPYFSMQTGKILEVLNSGAGTHEPNQITEHVFPAEK